MKFIEPINFKPDLEAAQLMAKYDKELCQQMAFEASFFEIKGMASKSSDGKVTYDVLVPASFLSGGKVLSRKNDDGTFTHTFY